jgi:pimeloyl-ACP methyl ester carboxylesterase
VKSGGVGGKEEDPVARFAVPRWLAVVSSAIGSLLGLLSGLYSSEFRYALESSFRNLNPTALYVVVATVIASASSIMIYRWLARAKQQPIVNDGRIEIRADALPLPVGTLDAVVGRHLRYLESERDSKDLIVFLHGLGLDANDFRPYLAESRYHCLALTLYGFNTDEKGDPHYAPISLDTHIRLLEYALRRIRKDHPDKRMTLVGFSFGADMILFLNEAVPQLVRRLEIHRAVLLDPNIDESTTTISSRIAKVDREQPLAQLVGILDSANEVTEFRYLCEYLHKITKKDFGQIQRHAREVVMRWDRSLNGSNDLFLDLMGRLSRNVDGVNVVLSFNFERLFNEVAHRAMGRGLDANCFECSTCDHFELISPNFLRDRLEGMLSHP